MVQAGNQVLQSSPKSGILALDKQGRETFARKEYAEIQNFRVSNLAARQWYNEHVSTIKNQIDTSLPLESQARQAFELRNQYRTEARNLMANQEQRQALDIKSPNAKFDALVNNKMVRKNMTREEALRDIIDTSTKTSLTVNEELGV